MRRRELHGKADRRRWLDVIRHAHVASSGPRRHDVLNGETVDERVEHVSCATQRNRSLPAFITWSFQPVTRAVGTRRRVDYLRTSRCAHLLYNFANMQAWFHAGRQGCHLSLRTAHDMAADDRGDRRSRAGRYCMYEIDIVRMRRRAYPEAAQQHYTCLWIRSFRERTVPRMLTRRARADDLQRAPYERPIPPKSRGKCAADKCRTIAPLGFSDFAAADSRCVAATIAGASSPTPHAPRRLQLR